MSDFTSDLLWFFTPHCLLTTFARDHNIPQVRQIRMNVNHAHKCTFNLPPCGLWNLNWKYNNVISSLLFVSRNNYSIQGTAGRYSQYWINKRRGSWCFSPNPFVLINSSVTRPTSNSVCCPCSDVCGYCTWRPSSWQEVGIASSASIFFLMVVAYLCQEGNYSRAANLSVTLFTCYTLSSWE